MLRVLDVRNAGVHVGRTTEPKLRCLEAPFLSAVVALMAGVIVAAHAQPMHHQDLCFSYEYGFLPC
jgi:hypothetical protein